MYLEAWMILCLIFAFGFCAVFSNRRGFYTGSLYTIQALEDRKLIRIEEDGSIKRWTPYSEDIKKARKKT